MKLLFALLLLLLSTSPVFAADQKESAYDRVVRTGTIRCGYGISPPALVQDPNTKVVSGLDYDIWQEIGRELGLKIEFTEEAGWGNFIEGLRSHRYDAFCSEMWADPGRAKFLSLSIPVMYSSLYIYARADDTRFDGNLERVNAPDVTIPAIEGDVSVALAQNRFPNAKIFYLPQTGTVSDILLAIRGWWWGLKKKIRGYCAACRRNRCLSSRPITA
jgi:polar amino acid transport system substrate-binding protein